MKEIEIKLRCRNTDLQTISRLTELTSNYIFEKPNPFATRDVYFDTSGGLLLRSGASLRARKMKDRLCVTFKSRPFRQDAELIREEREEEVPGEAFRALIEKGIPPAFCAPALRRLTENEGLCPVLEVRNRRRILPVIHKDKGLVAELSLDDVTFLRNGKTASYFGIEVELKENGGQTDLETLSDEFKKRFPQLVPDTESKFEKGVRLMG